MHQKDFFSGQESWPFFSTYGLFLDAVTHKHTLLPLNLRFQRFLRLSCNFQCCREYSRPNASWPTFLKDAMKGRSMIQEIPQDCNWIQSWHNSSICSTETCAFARDLINYWKYNSFFWPLYNKVHAFPLLLSPLPLQGWRDKSKGNQWERKRRIESGKKLNW